MTSSIDFRFHWGVCSLIRISLSISHHVTVFELLKCLKLWLCLEVNLCIIGPVNEWFLLEIPFHSGNIYFILITPQEWRHVNEILERRIIYIKPCRYVYDARDVHGLRACGPRNLKIEKKSVGNAIFWANRMNCGRSRELNNIHEQSLLSQFWNGNDSHSARDN